MQLDLVMIFKNLISMYSNAFWKILVFSLIISGSINAQNYDTQLSTNRSRLQEIKVEIARLNKQLADSKNKASSVSEQISSIDKELSLISRAKGLLEREQRILERRSSNNRVTLKETKQQLVKLKKLYSDRMVYFYKYGRIKNLALILTSGSLNQALVRTRYLKLIADYDAKTITAIKEKKESIEQIQKQLADDIDSRERSIRSKQKEESKFQSRLDDKNVMLSKIKKDQSWFKAQISTKKKEQSKLTGIIAALEKARKEAKTPGASPKEEFVTIDFENFKKGKGKLPWPVRGRIVSKYGKQYDPVSKTSINNSGIGIHSKVGTPVKCVFRGVVRMITYMSGYGNTVIIDHGNGYYSVYSHLSEIYVGKNDVVDMNQIIAQVGDSGSLAGSKLHFEIYGGNKSYNPLTWLRKS
jgi:septal ring factor EnvC (AmiA/AmiB activator)